MPEEPEERRSADLQCSSDGGMVVEQASSIRALGEEEGPFRITGDILWMLMLYHQGTVTRNVYLWGFIILSKESIVGCHYVH